MKKLFILLVSVVLLTACECPYAWREESPYYQTKGLTLMQEDLYGTWQGSELMFGDYEVKEIVISRQRRGLANVNLGHRYETGTWNATYQYVLDGKFLYFQSYTKDRYGNPEDGPHKFKVIEFMSRDLVLQDCYNGKKGVMQFCNACSGY